MLKRELKDGDRVIVHVPPPEKRNEEGFSAGWVKGFEFAEGMHAYVSTAGRTMHALCFDRPVAGRDMWSWNDEYLEYDEEGNKPLDEQEFLRILRG